jgi:hypothetical protein
LTLEIIQSMWDFRLGIVHFLSIITIDNQHHLTLYELVSLHCLFRHREGHHHRILRLSSLLIGYIYYNTLLHELT